MAKFRIFFRWNVDEKGQALKAIGTFPIRTNAQFVVLNETGSREYHIDIETSDKDFISELMTYKNDRKTMNGTLSTQVEITVISE